MQSPPQRRWGRLSDKAIYAAIGGSTRSDEVHRRLRHAIAAGLFVDGERLPSEADVASLFAVSQATARHALARLREEGLVCTRRGRAGGSFVTVDEATRVQPLRDALRAMSRLELRDLVTWHTSIALSTTRLAVRYVGPADVDQLDFLLRSHGDDLGDACRTENSFHLQLAALSQSPRLTRAAIDAQSEYGPLIWLTLSDPDERAEAHRSRRALLDQLVDRHEEEAVRVMEDHLQRRHQWLSATHRLLRKGSST